MISGVKILWIKATVTACVRSFALNFGWWKTDYFDLFKQCLKSEIPSAFGNFFKVFFCL